MSRQGVRVLNAIYKQNGIARRVVSTINSIRLLTGIPVHLPINERGCHRFEGRKFGNCRYINLRSAITAMPTAAPNQQMALLFAPVTRYASIHSFNLIGVRAKHKGMCPASAIKFHAQTFQLSPIRYEVNSPRTNDGEWSESLPISRR
jgi:hypothetical protein